jgi:hypothetical protein
MLLIGIALIAFTGCDVYLVEPRIDIRDQVIGYYEMEEYSQTYNEYTFYGLNITKGGYNSNTIYLNNFYGANISVVAHLSYDRITIPNQYVNGYDIEGVGTVYANRISFSYSVKDRYHSKYTDFCETDAYYEY